MIKLIVTDLDNTIYNWVDFYVPAFNAMLKELNHISGISERQLKQAFKRVHQKHKTTEYAFAIEELDVLPEVQQGKPPRYIREKYDVAIEAFRRTRNEKLRMYEGVASTLEQLRQEERKTIAHSDAMMFYALYRLKQLKAENLFDGILAAKDHGIPTHHEDRDLERWQHSYDTPIPYKRELPSEIAKPNPQCLAGLLSDFNVLPKEAIYVGDSLNKDIKMAQECSVYDVYAEYGRHYNQDNYEELIEISHWASNDISRETESIIKDVQPSFVISRFAELNDVIRRIESSGLCTKSRSCSAAS